MKTEKLLKNKNRTTKKANETMKQEKKPHYLIIIPISSSSIYKPKYMHFLELYVAITIIFYINFVGFIYYSILE